MDFYCKIKYRVASIIISYILQMLRASQQKKQLNHRLQQYNRHKSYLKKIKHSSLYCPRYDMLSLNNNLLLHQNYNPKKELQPKKLSFQLQQLEVQIKKKQEMKFTSKPQQKQQVKWYENVLKDSQTVQKRFKFEYQPSSSPSFSLREGFNKLYNIRLRQNKGKTKYSSFYSTHLS